MRARPYTEWPDPPGDPPHAPTEGRVVELNGVDAIRSWLVRGTRKTAIDPRRRTGRHAQARRLLATDTNPPNSSAPAWQDTVSAIQRHTVDAGLARLPKDDRHIVTLAFLEGHSNSELAAMLGISVRTVGRRLFRALDVLEEYLSHVGMWIASIALLALSGIGNQLFRASRAVSSFRSLRWPPSASWVAAGAVTIIAFGAVIATPATPAVRAHPSTPRYSTASGVGPANALANALEPPGDALTATVTTPAVSRDGSPAPSAGGTSSNQTRGCGKPTDAAPAVPVGPRSGQPGAPVSHPTAGGCWVFKGLNH